MGFKPKFKNHFRLPKIKRTKKFRISKRNEKHNFCNVLMPFAFLCIVCNGLISLIKVLELLSSIKIIKFIIVLKTKTIKRKNT